MAAATSSGRPGPAHGGGVDHALHEALAQLAERGRGHLEHVGVDRPGRHRVDPHLVARRLLGQRLGEADHARLGGRVDGGQLRADAPGLRGHVHDGAAAPLVHARQHGVGHGQHAAQVHRDHAVPLGLVGAGEEVVVGDAGVVDQDVDGPEVGLDRLHRRAHRCGVAHVHRVVARPCRSAAATSAPSAARRSQVAAPMPPTPPVTSATFPSSLMAHPIHVRSRSCRFNRRDQRKNDDRDGDAWRTWLRWAIPWVASPASGEPGDRQNRRAHPMRQREPAPRAGRAAPRQP